MAQINVLIVALSWIIPPVTFEKHTNLEHMSIQRCVWLIKAERNVEKYNSVLGIPRRVVHESMVL